MITVKRISKGPWGSLQSLITIEVDDIEINGVKHIIDSKGNNFIAGPSKQDKEGKWNDLVRFNQDAQDDIRNQICEHEQGYDVLIGVSSPASQPELPNEDSEIPF